MSFEKWIIHPEETRVIDIESATSLKVGLVGGQIDVVAHDEPGVRIEVHGVTVKDLRPLDSGYRLTVLNGEETAPEVLDTVRGLDLRVSRISIAKPTLDEVYLDRTGRSLREEEGSRDDAFKRRLTMRRARP